MDFGGFGDAPPAQAPFGGGAHRGPFPKAAAAPRAAPSATAGLMLHTTLETTGFGDLATALVAG
eukprot:9200240-Pyramimonas_sp.AAC.1